MQDERKADKTNLCGIDRTRWDSMAAVHLDETSDPSCPSVRYVAVVPLFVGSRGGGTRNVGMRQLIPLTARLGERVH